MLKEVLIEKIKKMPLTFRDFMELALYHPDYGYYIRNVTLGKEGDFYTAPILSKSFGYTLGKYIFNLNQTYGIPLTLLEFGAGTGKMAQDILVWFAAQGLFPEYHILEISAHLREVQRKNLECQQNQIRHLPEFPKNFSGIIIANEVVDAFPVHRVIYQKGIFQEIYVGVDDNGKFFTYPSRLSSPEIELYLKEANISPVEGQIFEVNLEAGKWLEEIYQKLNRGAFIIIDYGFDTAELYHHVRSTGTLAAFSRHRQKDPLQNPGEQDITAHVDFGMLRKKAKTLGFKEELYLSQGEFLMKAGIMEFVKRDDLTRPLESYQETLKIKKLILPPMGEVFKVLVLIKN
ncbi:class I SAM-dependent methyltransferase [Carboxydothermus ferrireducens]|uniref:SAM-dependent MidA family methyltransferase n=1 Tax=Carboxydothermus ferrireducens DSM 11255 TaxID=1119529 RepID=A0ABX2R7S6_9THEO|nr:SAM-dependent methyltransferase [Carboxydothermus ferrireducens]NYE57228.1 SAM-dependent MidA family methyltransferase [Carboxydothermus ferrireducens DSM 11255]